MEQIKKFSDKELFEKSKGIIGTKRPITPTTRAMYEKKLLQIVTVNHSS